MSPQEIDTLRKECKKMMIDLDMDNRSTAGYRTLAEALTRSTGRNVSVATLCMGLTGYRRSIPYQNMIKELHVLLAEAVRTGGLSLFSKVIHEEKEFASVNSHKQEEVTDSQQMPGQF